MMDMSLPFSSPRSVSRLPYGRADRGARGPSVGPALLGTLRIRLRRRVTRRCAPGGSSVVGRRSPEGATGWPSGDGLGRSGDQVELSRSRGGLGPVGRAELAQDMGNVLFDRVERHDQLAGDPLV